MDQESITWRLGNRCSKAIFPSVLFKPYKSETQKFIVQRKAVRFFSVDRPLFLDWEILSYTDFAVINRLFMI